MLEFPHTPLCLHMLNARTNRHKTTHLTTFHKLMPRTLTVLTHNIYVLVYCYTLVMGVITVKVNDDLEKRFRKTVSDRKGLHKGVLGNAVEEAMEDWVKKL